MLEGSRLTPDAVARNAVKVGLVVGVERSRLVAIFVVKESQIVEPAACRASGPGGIRQKGQSVYFGFLHQTSPEIWPVAMGALFVQSPRDN